MQPSWSYFSLVIFSLLHTIYSFNVVGYLPEWRHEGADFGRLCQHLTHLIFFSLELTPKGEILALDRLPRAELMTEAREAASKHQTKLMVCFGGNGRSGGFSVMVRNDKNRKVFLENLLRLLDQFGLDGVDYNWEYPGYRMGRGYLEEKEILKDYEGLAKLISETKTLFAGTNRVVSMAYYPDTRQERLLHLFGLDEEVDLMFSMSYDQGSPQHSSRELARQTVKQADNANLVMSKLCLGVPFYGRNNQGEWITYEDLVQQHSLTGKEDEVTKDGIKVGLNGKNTISWKVKLAMTEKLGGVMIWEVGQDCRVDPVKRGETVHVKTCPQGEDSSLLAAITNTKKKYKPADAARDEF